MARSDGSVRINTLVNSDGFGKGINTMKKQMGGLTSAIGKLGLAIAATFAVGKLVQFGKEAIELGSDLQEVQNVVDVTFTTMSDKVNEFARGAAEAAGLSETMAKKYMGTFGAMSKAFGFVEEEAFNMSASLTQMVGDVASFYNLTQEEAYTKLKSVFTGETESLKDLGVVMTQTALDSYAMAEGWGKTTKQMTEQEKVALRYAFVLDQLSAANGDFVRTSDSWANQTRILSLTVDSLKANIGQALINVFTPLLKVINQVVAKLAEMSQYVVAFSELIVGKSTSGGGGSPGEALAELESGYQGVTEATKDATKAQKKYLSGLDEIRTFTEADAGVESLGTGGGISFDMDKMGMDDTKITSSGVAIDNLKEKIKGLVREFPILGNVISIVKNYFGLLHKVISDVANLIAKPILDNKNGFLTAMRINVEFTYQIFETLIRGFDEAMIHLNQIYDEKIHPVVESITDDISSFVGKFLAWFESDMGPVLDRWAEKFDLLWSEHIGPLLKNLNEFFGEVAGELGYLWDELLYPILDGIATYVLPMITPVIEEIGNMFMETVGKIADIISYVIDIFSGWIKYLVGTFTGDWERAWEGMVEIFKGIINIIAELFEIEINRIIDLINNVIRGINEIGGAVGVKGKIPVIPEFEIPKLATGAVIPPNAPFMAVLGDQKHGTNIEAPLDTIKQAVREVVGTGSGGGMYQFSAQINRRTLFEEMIDEAKLRQSSSGRNPFDLA